MNELLDLLLVLLASGGFWAFLQSFVTTKALKKTNLEQDIKELKEMQKMVTEAVRGLSHDRIIEKCNEFSDLGCITDEQFNNLYANLWEPYQELGGNGSAKRAMERVAFLPRN